MLKKLVRPMASLKFAVFIISALSILIASGTIIESRYNADIAAKLVYKTPWMFLVMGLFALNLSAVLVDRLPWKRRHVPFILAHTGILILLAGAVMTMVMGLDGTLRIAIGQSGKFVQVNETEVSVWSSFDGDRYSKVFEKEVDFYIDPPTEKKKFRIPMLAGEIEVLEYQPFAIPNRVVAPSQDDKAGAALRFLIHNSRVNVNEWLVQKKKGETAHHNFGPATFHLGTPPDKSQGLNELWVEIKKDGKLAYTIFYKDVQRKPVHGAIAEGQVVSTGWMDLEFRVLRFLPQASDKLEFKILDRPTPMTTAALRLQFHGQEHWLALDDMLKLFTDKAVYILSYGHRRIDMGFELNLKEFQMGTYQGTSRASSYQSVVRLPDGSEQLISMNEPLKQNGLTFYQASFENGADGKPVASIFSVNYDPGRFFKYLGSFILSIGIVWLFYDKRKAASAVARKMNASL